MPRVRIALQPPGPRAQPDTLPCGFLCAARITPAKTSFTAASPRTCGPRWPRPRWRAIAASSCSAIPSADTWRCALPSNARIRGLCAAAAICPPLDLNAATKAFDHPARAIYRRHIFAGLNKAYAAAAVRKRVCTPVEAVVSARSCRDRDALTVVPRFGFRNADDYYECESAGPRLHRLRIPALVITTRHDPIIPAETLVPTLENASPALSVAWIERGGHIYGPHKLENHAMHWLSKQ